MDTTTTAPTTTAPRTTKADFVAWEDQLSPLLESVVARSDRPDAALEVAVAVHLRRARDLAWAASRYPQFDCGALLLSRPLAVKWPTVPERGARIDAPLAAIEVRVPRFAIATLRKGKTQPAHALGLDDQEKSKLGNAAALRLHVGQQPHCSAGCLAFQTNERCPEQHDGRTLADKGPIIAATIPPIPQSVWQRLWPLEDRFGGLHLVYEAEWRQVDAAAPVERDPLVVGMIDGIAFVLDHYDLTNVEHYIRHEFTA